MAEKPALEPKGGYVIPFFKPGDNIGRITERRQSLAGDRFGARYLTGSVFGFSFVAIQNTADRWDAPDAWDVYIPNEERD